MNRRSLNAAPGSGAAFLHADLPVHTAPGAAFREQTYMTKIEVHTEGGHWYAIDGQPKYTLPKLDGSGDRPTTLRDARKFNLLPSVTTITKVLHSEGLLQWKIRESVLAVLSSPKRDTESLDEFVERVLYVDREADETAKAARDLGTEIHGAIERALTGQTWDEKLKESVSPVLEAVNRLGKFHSAERVVIGKGYAGKMDCLLETPDGFIVVDFKTAKRIPKASYDEHRLQLAAYAGALKENVISTANIYISTTEIGSVKTVVNDGWSETFIRGWLPLVSFWQWKNNYKPAQ